MNERRREFAILRALGARRRTVSTAIVLEASAIGALGAVLGFAVYVLIFALARAVVKDQTGVVLEPWSGHAVFAIAPAAVVLLAAAAGALPARQAYATDVASHLSPTQ
jgi:putative ABC transport system permease protein